MLNKNVICFIGPPGSGKGTYSLKCFQEATKPVHRFSIGDQLRLLNLEKHTGDLAQNELIDQILRDNLKNPIQNIIIDGYPRSVEQLDLLLNRKLSGIIKQIFLFNLQINDQEMLLSRLDSRHTCAKCGYSEKYGNICPQCSTTLTKRIDDLDAVVVKKRIDIYYENCEDIISMAQKNSIIIYDFDASLAIEHVFALVKPYFLQSID